ncbi:hypothetical protein ASPZODRAFT_75266, partial [Penicilliopsis zonata CBS 506.65]
KSKYFCATRVLEPVPEQKTTTHQEVSIPNTFLHDVGSPDSDLSDVPDDYEDNRPAYWTPPGTPPPTKKIKLKQETPRRPAKTSRFFPDECLPAASCQPFPPITKPTFGLVQEQLAHDPFRLLIATIFLNRTRGSVALPVLWEVFARYPTVESMASAEFTELVSMIRRLGFQNQRARKCIALAQTWLAQPPTRSKRYRRLHYPRRGDGRDLHRDEVLDEHDPRLGWEVAHLPGVGEYALDSWRIFCRDELRGLAHDWKGDGATEGAQHVPEWKAVVPRDKELRAYLTWMWLKEGWEWDFAGERRRASRARMRAALVEGTAYEVEGRYIVN